MELLDSSMDKVANRVYHVLKTTIPESILGKMTISVSTISGFDCCNLLGEDIMVLIYTYRSLMLKLCLHV